MYTKPSSFLDETLNFLGSIPKKILVKPLILLGEIRVKSPFFFFPQDNATCLVIQLGT